jgi:hypothetical protein
MRRDSDMAEQIELRLLAQGVIALPLHDSFIIPQSTRDKGALMEAMAAALYKQIGKNPASTMVSTKNIPQYGRGRVWWWWWWWW